MDSIKVGVLGSTGAVGKKVVRYLVEYQAKYKPEIDLPPLKSVYAYTRRETTINSFISKDELKQKPFLEEAFNKLVQMVKIDFENPPSDFGTDLNILFSCLGATVNKDGKEGQYKIDHDYTVNLSTIARKNGVAVCALVSAVGANAKSWTHYSKMKGEIEEDMKKLEFPAFIIARPGLIRTTREESRPLETIFGTLAVLDTFSYISVRSDDIAKAMISLTLEAAVTQYKLLLESVPTAAEDAPTKEDTTKSKCECKYLGSRELALTSNAFDKYLQ